MSTPAVGLRAGRTNTRWFMTSLIVLATCLNYMDRANLAVAAPVMQRQLGINAAVMGIIFSAFSWSYTACIPFAGVLLDRFGPRILYTIGIIGWSVATAAVGFTNSLGALIGCRIGVGAFEAPAFPTNIRCITAWHPSRERALAAGFYNAAQFVALGFLTPVLAWIVVRFSWHVVFYATGAIGLIVGWVWHRWYRDPKDSTSANREEIEYIAAGGGLAGNTNTAAGVKAGFTWGAVGQLLSYRQVWGLIIGQGTLATALFFFLTWFPSYLVKAKGLGILKTGVYAMIPFLVGIVGAILGGKLSDWMLAKGYSESAARKIPICVGFALAIAIVGANYTNSIAAVIAFMTVSFFGTAMASAVTHAVCSDMAPQGRVGMLSGLQFLCGNIGGMLSPLVVGFIVAATGGFNLALVFVSGAQIVGLLCYIFLMGRVSRIQLTEAVRG